MLTAGGAGPVVLTDATVATSDTSTFIIQGSTGNDIVDASAVTSAGDILFIAAGDGIDAVTTGAGNDELRMTSASLTGADTFDGGAGDDVLVLQSGGVLGVLEFDGVTRIETIRLSAGGTSISLDDSQTATSDVGLVRVVGMSSTETMMRRRRRRVR